MGTIDSFYHDLTEVIKWNDFQCGYDMVKHIIWSFAMQIANSIVIWILSVFFDLFSFCTMYKMCVYVQMFKCAIYVKFLLVDIFIQSRNIKFPKPFWRSIIIITMLVPNIYSTSDCGFIFLRTKWMCTVSSAQRPIVLHWILNAQFKGLSSFGTAICHETATLNALHKCGIRLIIGFVNCDKLPKNTFEQFICKLLSLCPENHFGNHHFSFPNRMEMVTLWGFMCVFLLSTT